MRALNLGLRFVLELAAFTAVGYWGFAANDGLAAWALGLGLPVLLATVWGVFVSPRAPVPTADPVRLGVEVGVFGAAVAALATAGSGRLAAVLAAAVAVHLVLTFVLGQRQPLALPERSSSPRSRTGARRS